MSIVTEEGILLRTHPYSESSQVMRFLTPHRGILAVLAKGVRRDSSRGKGGAETFDEVVLVYSYREHRDLQTLRDLQVHRSRRGLGADLGRFGGASLLAELLLAHTLQEENEPLFLEVREALDRIAVAGPRSLPGAVLAGAWGLLARAGFPPVLEGCAVCGTALPPQAGLLHFHVGSGGLLCDRCAPAEGGRRMGPGARADLARLVRGEAVEPVRGAAAHLGLLESFALHHLAPRRGFRSIELLRAAIGEGPGEEPSA